MTETVQQKQIDDEVLEAATYHVRTLRRRVWDRMPTDARLEAGKLLGELLERGKRLADLLDVGKVVELSAGELTGTGMGIFQLVKGFEQGKRALGRAVAAEMPELWALAKLLQE